MKEDNNLSNEELKELISNLQEAEQESVNDSEQGVEEGFNPYNSKDSLLKLLRDLLNFKVKKDHDKLLKVGNLHPLELGSMSKTLRRYSDVALFMQVSGYYGASDYLKSKADILSASSLSRKGKFLDLMVTQKRVTRSMGAPVTKSTRDIFGRETVTKEGYEDE